MNNSLEQRQRESSLILRRHLGRVPVPLFPAAGFGEVTLDKSKYLVQSHITVGEFLHIIRQKLEKLCPQESIYIFVQNSTIPRMSMLMSEVYATYKSEDGFLYMEYAKENTFGSLYGVFEMTFP